MISQSMMVNQKYQEIDTQSANRVPPKLAEIDLGNDEANRINGNLRRAGITVDADLEVKLPKWGEMTAIYGAQPVILGLDRCETFRANLKKNTDAMIGPAGLFNTGLNRRDHYYLFKGAYANSSNWNLHVSDYGRGDRTATVKLPN